MKSQIQADLQADLQTVWALVTDASRADWRSDLSRIEVVQPDKQFIEYTPDGVATAFTVQSKRACQWYEFTMENRYLSGRWTGKFEALGPYTRVVFTEYVEAKSIWRKPFVKRYLQKQQARYMEDLVRALKQQQ